MRMRKAILILISIALILLLGGCDKSWSINFVTVSDIDNWILKSTYELVPEGLLIASDNYVTAPFIWTGDFTITVRFKLAANVMNRVFGAIWVGSSSGWRPADLISFPFNYGGGLDPSYTLWTDGASHSEANIASSSTEIPGIVNNAINTWVMRKVGDNFTVTMNGALIANWTNVIYDSTNFFLTLNSSFLLNDEIIYKSVSVKYEEGNMTPVI